MSPLGVLRRSLPLAAALGLVAAPSAFGHAAFVDAQPHAGARVEVAPQRVVLAFTEPLNRGLTRATLVAVAGDRRIDVRVEASDGRRLVLEPRHRLDTGAYRVEWHTVSTEDGHALEGSFSFGVRVPAAGGAQQLEESPLARAGWVRVGLRLLLYVSVLLFAAAVLLPLLVWPRRSSWLAPAELDAEAPSHAVAARERERRIAGDVAWLSVGAAVAATLAEAADAAGGVSVSGLHDFLLTSASGAGRLVLIGALVVAALLVGRHRRWAAACAVIALGGIAASGHAASASPRVLNVLNDWVHLLAGALWLGGIGLVVAVWWPGVRRGGADLRRGLVRHVLPRFGRVALPAFLVAAATGIVSLLVQLGHVDALWTTAYGRVLLAKIVLVGAVAAASFWHAQRLRPRLLAVAGAPPARDERRHWRLIRAEPAVGLGVVAAVALLVAFPLPPRQLTDASEAVAAPPACDPCPLPRPRADELSVAGRAGSHLVAAWLRRDDGRLRGTVRLQDIQGRPSRAPVTIPTARTRTCGTGCVRIDAPLAPRLRVVLTERGRRWAVALPARWDEGSTRAARALVARAEQSMRRLASVRETEEVTSGPGSYARTDYRLRAPDRMAYETSSRSAAVIVGDREWVRAGGEPWSRQSYGSGLPFSTRRWFRWTTYARAARLLDRRREDGRRVAELALADEATPVWFRLVIDERTGRVLREEMAARAHFMTSRYFAFNEPVTVRPPDGG
jgi:copper transport protein